MRKRKVVSSGMSPIIQFAVVFIVIAALALAFYAGRL